MNNNVKYIGINQKVPFKVLDFAVLCYLEDGVINKQLIVEQIKELTSGGNRALKSVSHLLKIIKRNVGLIDQFRKTLQGSVHIQLSNNNKKAFSLCLFCLTYPIAYDLLIILATGFKVQKKLNRQFILQKISAIYGSNRAVELAIDAIIPFFIELGILEREKPGIYTLSEKLRSTNIFIRELIIYVDIRLSSSKSLLLDDLTHRSWYSYFEINDFNISSNGYLIRTTESSIGKGYLTTKV